MSSVLKPWLIYLVCTVVVQVVHEEFGIIEGLMTTVHATTGSLQIQLPSRFLTLTNCPFMYAITHFTARKLNSI